MTVAVASGWLGNGLQARLMRDFVVAARPRLLAAYLALLALGATAAMLAAPIGLPSDRWMATVILTVGYVVGAQVKVVDGHENSWDLTTLPGIAGLLLLPPGAALFVVTVGVLVSEIGMRRTWVRVVFNVSQVTCSMAIGVALLAAVGGPVSGPSDLLHRLHWILAVVAVEQLVNKSLVATVIALYQGGSPVALWWAINQHSLVGEGALACSAVLVVFGWLFDARLAGLLVVPLLASWVVVRRGRAVHRAAEARLVLARAKEQLRDVPDPSAAAALGARLFCELCADAAVLEVDGCRAEAFRDGIGSENAGRLRRSLAGLPSPVTFRSAHRSLVDESGYLGQVHVAWLSSSRTPERHLLLDPLSEAIAAALRRSALLRQAAEVHTLREVSRARSDLLAAVSHELHPPLAIVIANAESLAQQTAEPDTRSRAASIAATGQHLTGLVNDLLDAARLETGRYALNRGRIDLRPVAAAALEAAHAAHPGVTFTLDSPPEPIAVEADPSRLLQVLGNLLSNAARHGKPDGTVRLLLDADDRVARIAVEDDGPGIPAPDRERVFDKFHRGSSSSPGLGLGLSIARDLVLAHEGTIHVEDASTGGARFVVRLPR